MDNPRPVYAGIPYITKITGLSRSSVYQELRMGNFRAVEYGSKNLIHVESALHHLSQLPAATFGKAA